jgi:CheY-like chemotaxis protein
MEKNVSSLGNILLVDDDEKDVELILEALRKCNLSNRVKSVNDGVEALAFLRKEGNYKNRSGGNPSFILLDLKMPKVDGLELLREIKQCPETKLIPTIVLTSSAEEKDLIESYRIGANAYVVKPVEFEKFFEAVKYIGLFWAVLNTPPFES